MVLEKNITWRDCADPAISEFPDVLLYPLPRHDLSVLTLFMSFYVFLAMSIVCDEYFVPAVERVCLEVGMTPDVVGATFMAASTSAPEFFVGCIATFVTEGDIGIGTIVGSAVFNLLAIPALCGITASEAFKIDWWPIARDITWYVISIILLTVTVYDSKIELYESIILVLLVFINWTMLVKDKSIQKLFRKTEADANTVVATENDEEDDEPFHVFALPRGKSCLMKIYWILIWPWHFLFFISIPNIYRNFFKNWYWLALFCSTLWIIVLSYMITWFLTVFGYYNRIPDSVMGITILAAGTSMPELVSSYIVAKKGAAFSSMAVANSMSSNTFDILVCLGLPWTIKLIFSPEDAEERTIVLDSSGLTIVVALLLISALSIFVMFLLSKFTMSRKFGIYCLLTYIVFVIISCMVELNVFGEFHKPVCPYEFKMHKF